LELVGDQLELAGLDLGLLLLQVLVEELGGAHPLAPLDAPAPLIVLFAGAMKVLPFFHLQVTLQQPLLL